MAIVTSCADSATTTENCDKNYVIENIMARRSIRKYKPETVDRETMKKILECGINAPN
jgi:nitroreductase